MLSQSGNNVFLNLIKTLRTLYEMKLWSKPTKLSMKSNLTAPEQPKIFNRVLFFFHNNYWSLAPFLFRHILPEQIKHKLLYSSFG